MISQQLNDDLKAAMLARDSARVETLRGLKSAILYAEVAAGKRESGLADEDILILFAREAKKRQESADLYVRGGAQERADKELTEKALIETYLPKRLSHEELAQVIDKIIAGQEAKGPQAMGRVIGAVKAEVGTAGDGAVIARLVRERLIEQ